MRATRVDDLDWRDPRDAGASPARSSPTSRVDQKENCFPMIPRGAAHNEMILAPGQAGGVAGVTDEGKMLV